MTRINIHTFQCLDPGGVIVEVKLIGKMQIDEIRSSQI
jgi:hypothetical protein